MEKNDPIGDKKWDMYEVTSLYFPEVHTTSYDTAVKFCREIGNRTDTDEETRAKSLQNAVLAFSVRHVLGERNAIEVNYLLMPMLIFTVVISLLSNINNTY